MKAPLPVLLVGLIACGSDTTLPAPQYPPMAGSYVAPATGNTTNGSPINATVAMTMTQSSGSLIGTYSITFMFVEATLVQTGSFTGTMTSGNYPQVTLTLDRDDCAGYTTQYTGSYDPGVKRLTVTGYVDITATNMINGACGVTGRMSTTLVLQR